MSLETARRVLKIEAQAIQDVLARLNASFEKAVDVLFACKGRVVVSGMGKSGLIGRKISATLSSTGTPSFFLHPAEALHGDLGMLARGDAILAVSYGGQTEEIIQLLEALKRLEMPLVTLTGCVRSTLAQASDVVLDVSVREEACSLNLAPTASTTVAMAVGDALAISLRQLHVLFEPTGVSCARTILGMRLRQARSLLAARSDETVTQIALACGFHSIATFYRVFHAAYGIAPGDVRAGAAVEP